MKNFLIMCGAVIIGLLISTFVLNDDSNKVKMAQAAHHADGEHAQEAAAETIQPLPDELYSSAPEGARVYFIEPSDGAVVSSPVVVKFGIENMQVAKAGEKVENSGHHHILINLEEMPDMKQPLPANEQIIHFGGAQTETSLTLPAGEHTLQLLLGNFAHIPHDPPVMSERITITVQ